MHLLVTPKNNVKYFSSISYCVIKFVYAMVPSFVAETAFSWYLEKDLSYWL